MKKNTYVWPTRCLRSCLCNTKDITPFRMTRHLNTSELLANQTFSAKHGWRFSPRWTTHLSIEKEALTLAQLSWFTNRSPPQSTIEVRLVDPFWRTMGDLLISDLQPTHAFFVCARRRFGGGSRSPTQIATSLAHKVHVPGPTVFLPRQRRSTLVYAILP